MISFSYYSSPYLPVTSIKVHMAEYELSSQDCGLKKEGEIWSKECSIPEGEYLYRFIINDEISINDPQANYYLPDANEQLWSVLTVDKYGQRLYNQTEYSVNIAKYNITDGMYDFQQPDNKKAFVLGKDNAVVTRLEFENVTGLHTVSSVWYSPQGKVVQALEENLFTPDDMVGMPLVLWFALNLTPEKQYSAGIWSMKLLIDGMYILEDSFTLSLNESKSYNTSLLDIKR